MKGTVSTNTVYILLAAYNGSQFIKEQLNSILCQTHQNWKLLIRNDNSTDNTAAIIDDYALKYQSKIFIVKDQSGNLGSVQNFSMLLQYAKDKAYIMFCDQDDVWLPHKIELTLKEMKELEKEFSVNTALMVYTNFSYVDEKLNPITSKKNFSATKVESLSFANLLAQNPVYGCTMMINNKLCNIVNTIPLVAENHDYWIALTAITFGKMKYIKNQTVLYRQHGKNISGSHDNDSFIKRFRRVINHYHLDDISNKITMALVFKKIYTNQLSTLQLKIINDFVDLSKKRSFSLLKQNWKNGLRRQTFSQTFLLYFSIIFYKRHITNISQS